MEKIAAQRVAETIRDNGGHISQRRVAQLAGLNEGTVSRHIVQLMESGSVERTVKVCPCCGQSGKWVTLVSMPVFAPPRPRASPTKEKVTMIKRPRGRPPKHNGTVFGLMIAQLGVSNG